MKATKNIWFNKRLVIVGMSLLSIGVFTGCYYDKEDILYPGGNAPVDCSSIPASFTTDVQPLIMGKCAISGCHNAAGASGGLVFETYSQINAKQDRINARAIIQKSMPPGGALAPSESAKLKCWIDAGALNN